MQRTQQRTLWIALGVLALLVLAAPIFGAGLLGPRAMLGWSGARPLLEPWWVWGVGFGLGGLLRLAFWAVLVLLIIRFFRGWSGGGYHHDVDSPADILDRRYAAGEISREQYEEMRRTLSHSS
jgi:putative membrane protein